LIRDHGWHFVGLMLMGNWLLASQLALHLIWVLVDQERPRAGRTPYVPVNTEAEGLAVNESLKARSRYRFINL